GRPDRSPMRMPPHAMARTSSSVAARAPSSCTGTGEQRPNPTRMVVIPIVQEVVFVQLPEPGQRDLRPPGGGWRGADGPRRPFGAALAARPPDLRLPGPGRHRAHTEPA